MHVDGQHHDHHVLHIVQINRVEQHVVQWQGHQNVKVIEHGIQHHIVIEVVIVDVEHHEHVVQQRMDQHVRHIVQINQVEQHVVR